MSRVTTISGFVAASLAAVALPIAAHAVVGGGDTTAAQTAPSVIVFNQKLKGDDVKVTYAYLPSAGNLVIHGDSAGKADSKVLGSVKLEAGDHRDVSVKLNSAPKAGTALWASLTNADQKSFWSQSLPSENHFKIE
jgi:hypothetical protein